MNQTRVAKEIFESRPEGGRCKESFMRAGSEDMEAEGE
jgi:hypothetical protein